MVIKIDDAENSGSGRTKIAQGAEAILWRDGETLVKDRVQKGYRLKQLDALLRKQRTAHEASLLNATRRAGVCTPQIIEINETELTMEWLEGKRVKEALNSENCEKIGQLIGTAVGKMHTYDIIHGDLTTSNMILRDGELCFIDFGLGFQSQKIEDKAVDLTLLRHAIESTHWEILDRVWKAVLEAYVKSFARADEVIKALASIEKRGRYREH